MNTEIDPNPSKTQAPEAVEDISRWAEGAANDATRAVGEVMDAAEDAVNRTSENAKALYESAALKAGDVLEVSKDYARRNPGTVVLGAIAFGAAIGYLLLTPRRKPTFRERYADEPLAAVREAILEALSPVTQRVHQGYDSARSGAGKVMDRVHDAGKGGRGDSLSDQVGRIGSHLKFW